MNSDIPKIIHMTVGREMIIPCRVTAPNIAVTLKKVLLSENTLKVLLLLWILLFWFCLVLFTAIVVILEHLNCLNLNELFLNEVPRCQCV